MTIEERIIEAQNALAEAEKNYAAEDNDEWQRVWQGLGDELTMAQETAWMKASSDHTKLLTDLKDVVDAKKRELEALKNEKDG